MSIFSGKYDLCDHISMEKMYDKGLCKVSDELECFNLFRQRTGGVIHQHRRITVSEWNQDKVKEKCLGNFDYEEVSHEVQDRRTKEGTKIVKSYVYTYFNEKYESLKELNKKGVYITEDIHFETLLDIIPYYPHVVSFASSSFAQTDGPREYIVISEEPYYMQEYKRSLKDGGRLSFPSRCIQDLSRHYLEVVRTYYDYKLEERTKRVSLIGCKPLHNGYYELLLPKPADRLHEIRFAWKDGKAKTHWTNPKLSDCEDCVVWIHEDDVDNYLKEDIKYDNVMVEYVEACKLPNSARDS